MVLIIFLQSSLNTVEFSFKRTSIIRIKVKTLRSFFGSLPVVEWFTQSAPRIQSGEVNPVQLDEDTALQLMMSDPLLIPRPLMQVGADYRVGFDQEQVNRWIGLDAEMLNVNKKTKKEPPI